MDNPVSEQRLKELLEYDPDIGKFKWIQYRSWRALKGQVAGYTNKNGYREIRIDKTTYYEHKLAWLYFYGEYPGQEIDHINNKRDDNRISNLRLVSRSENLKNHSGKYQTNKSDVSGVNWCKNNGKWIWKAYICSEGKQIHLGYFNDKQNAIKARKKAELKYGFTLD